MEIQNISGFIVGVLVAVCSYIFLGSLYEWLDIHKEFVWEFYLVVTLGVRIGLWVTCRVERFLYSHEKSEECWREEEQKVKLFYAELDPIVLGFFLTSVFFVFISEAEAQTHHWFARSCLFIVMLCFLGGVIYICNLWRVSRINRIKNTPTNICNGV